MKLTKKSLEGQALLVVYDTKGELYFTTKVPTNLNTAQLLHTVSVALGVAEEELLHSQFQVEYWNN